jgi:hypothetical protein
MQAVSSPTERLSPQDGLYTMEELVVYAMANTTFQFGFKLFIADCAEIP